MERESNGTRTRHRSSVWPGRGRQTSEVASVSSQSPWRLSVRIWFVQAFVHMTVCVGVLFSTFAVLASGGRGAFAQHQGRGGAEQALRMAVVGVWRAEVPIVSASPRTGIASEGHIWICGDGGEGKDYMHFKSLHKVLQFQGDVLRSSDLAGSNAPRSQRLMPLKASTCRHGRHSCSTRMANAQHSPRSQGSGTAAFVRQQFNKNRQPRQYS